MKSICSVKIEVRNYVCPKVYNSENSGILKKLEKSGYIIYAAESTENALMFLGKKTKESDNKVFIITNGADPSVEFIEQIRDKHNCYENV